MMIESISEANMDDQDLLERRQLRQRRIQRATKRSGGGSKQNLLASPGAAVFCMAIALGSILAFWGGLPSWALLVMGLGAVLVLIAATLFWRARHKAPPELDDID
jgi:hypothetical protein